MISQTKQGAWVWDERPQGDMPFTSSIIRVPHPDLHRIQLTEESSK